jgi:putative MFS transporter
VVRLEEQSNAGRINDNGGLLPMLDAAPLSARYWLLITLLVLGLIFELYDFFIAGFIVSAIAPDWHLTFGQTSCILVSAGLGAIAGSLAFGRLADQFGRKFSLVGAGLLCSASAGAIALVPAGDWLTFSLLRFLVGVGYGGASVTQLAMIVEFTPTRLRTLFSSILLAPVAVGMLLASLTFAVYLPFLGWRGVAALGAAPALISLALWRVCPESIRWLTSKGRFDEARQTASRFLGIPEARIPAFKPSAVHSQSRSPLRELWADRRRFWLVALVYFGFNITITGCYLYGPVMIAQTYDITPRDAAFQFVYVSLVGALGRVIFAIVPHFWGRVRAGQISCLGAASAMVGAAIFHDLFVGGVPLLLIFLIGGALFWDGGVAAISPYAAEIFPVNMAARGLGLAQAASGVGKFFSPFILALMAGSSSLITPQATTAVVVPAFLFFAGGSLLAAIVLTVWGREPHGEPLTL